ncbi:MAG TPA: hypothetical protein VKH19_20070 [Gemmatimonadaceae bacterium]|nr:hypothetical protein [Gemmatimonadaceae bacterium]
MADNPNRSVEPFIDAAQGALRKAMDEACRVDLKKADTGELIRVEEALQSATEAAKEVVSLRLKRRQERSRGKISEHRIVNDETGTPWAVIAVYPSSRTVDQGTLPERFATGWLLFEHGDDVRRHAPVPEHWESLSDADLRFLCQHAEVATKRITPLRSTEETI